jgi:DNA primase catalytic core
MTIAEVKSNLEITDVARHLGIELLKGDKCSCPFHKDKNPSFQFSKEKQIGTCFSSNCEAGTMDVIGLIEKKLNLTTHEAINYLKANCMNAALLISDDKKQPSFPTQKRIELLKKVYNYFRNGYHLRKDNLGRNYMLSRNIDVEALDNAGVYLGYNSAQFHHRDRFTLEEKQGFCKLGLLKENNSSKTGIGFTPWASHCVIFPLKNKTGEIVSLYGRSTKYNSHFYLTNRKGLFPKYPVSTTKKVILTESIIDACSLIQSVIINENYTVLALYGTNGYTLEHTEALSQLANLDEVILFLDGDTAGNKAVEKLTSQISEELPKIAISKVNTPNDEDVNSLLEGHSIEVYEELINDRTFLFQLKRKEAEIIQEVKQEISLEIPSSPLLNTDNPEYIIYQTKDLKLALLGGINLQQVDRLRVTLLIERYPKLSPLHAVRQSGLDLYNDASVEKLIRSTAQKLELGTSEIRLAIFELIEKIEAYRLSKITESSVKQPKERVVTKQRQQDALAYLKAPNLLTRTNEDIGKSGMVGEENNRLLMYIVFTSRLRESPLNIICLGSSGTGKTHLQEKVAELIPEQDIIDATALSDNALYYFHKTALKHKLIVIEDMDGAENVLYQLRELMSKKKLTKQVVVKNSKGNMRTEQVHTEGPISVTGTTTKERIYEDNANRSLLLYLDNSKAHQEEIMDYQRKASAGKINHKLEADLKAFFKDMQSLLKPIRVINPFAELLKIPQEVFKPLRSNAHYLQFIECVTFYHQHQRTVKTTALGERYIETTLEDIEATNKLLKDVLLAKSDELSGACRTFFEVLKAQLKSTEKVSFYAKELRNSLRINPKTLSRYLYDLQRYNYIKIVGGDKHRRGYEYEVVDPKEYQLLQQNIKSALDKALEQVKQKSTSVPH